MAEQHSAGLVEVSTSLAEAVAAVQDAPVIAVDVETTGINYWTAQIVGVALYPVDSHVGFYFPVMSQVDPDESLVPMQDVLALVQFLFSNPSRLLIFHNALFDLKMFFKLGVHCHASIYDTMYGEHRLDNSYRGVYWQGDQLDYKLKTLTRRFLGHDQTTFEEATGGLPFDHVPYVQTAPYAVQDVYFTTQHYLRQLERLEMKSNAGLLEILEQFDFPLLPIITEMVGNGISIDTALAEEKITFFRSLFGKRTQQIAAVLQKSVNVSEKGVLRKVLQDFGLPVYPWTSLSEKSLKILGSNSQNGQARQFIKLVISRRYLANLVSKFFVPLLKRTDPTMQRLYIGDFHSLNNTGRFAASNPNMQALQKGSSVRRLIRAEEGHSIVAADFRNVEPRCLAQALLVFIESQGQDLATIKLRNLNRAKQVFGELLEERHFNRPYEPEPPLPYPGQSLLANFFLHPVDGQDDPYRFIAQQAFGIADPSKADRKRMKTIVLAIIFGKGIGSLMADLKQDYAATVQNLNQFATVMPELGSPTYHHEDGEWKKDKPHVRTYREEVWEMLRYSGEVTTLFGRKRRFPGLYHLRKCQRCRVTTYEGGKEYVWDIAPVQLWNYTVHAYVYRVWHAKTGTLIGTNNWRGNYAILHKEKSLTAWPFQQLSFRTIRRIEVGQDLVHFTPIEDLHREGFNAAIQATAGDVFKLAILRVNSLLPTFGARMILNVHDELVFSVPNQHLNQFVPAMVQAMTTPPASWWEIPIAVDVETGPNYGQLSHFELTA